MSATAPSTNKKYLATWARWENWASSKTGITVFPVDPYHLTLYIAQLATTGPKTIAESVTSAVSWVHSLAGLPSPTTNPMVKTALRGFKRLNSSAPTRKEPITPDILSKILLSHGHNNATLADLRIVFICLVSYAGFLRFNDLSAVTRKDCKITSDYLTIHLSRSKTDQFRQGSEVVISRTFKPTCPVAAAERYFTALGDPVDSSLPVLRRLIYTKKGLISSIHPLSYTRTREIVLDALRPIVPDISIYGLHSLRSGGATAACNAQVPAFLISKHGRWKTEAARNAYLKLDSVSTMLTSQSLGI